MNDAPIHSQLDDFLADQDDFPFEVQVVEMLRTHGLDPEHAGFYVDEVTGKLRQFDIRAFLKDGLKLQVDQQKDPWWFSHVCLNIECKRLSSERPLIVACTKRKQAENISFLSTHWHGEDTPDHIYTSQIPPDRVQLFQDAFGTDYQSFLGRDTKQAVWEKGKWKASGQQHRTDFYERWSQCVMASIDASRIMLNELSDRNRSGVWKIWSPAILVVPDDALFAAEVDANGNWGDIRPCKAIRHKVGVDAFDLGLDGWPSHRLPLSCFSIVTALALERFVESRTTA